MNNVEKAMGVLKAEHGFAMNVRLEHIDEAGYWFSFELEQDSRRQTWCVRHWEVGGARE